jgi:hypothetical protein
MTPYYPSAAQTHNIEPHGSAGRYGTRLNIVRNHGPGTIFVTVEDLQGREVRRTPVLPDTEYQCQEGEDCFLVRNENEFLVRVTIVDPHK